MHTNQIKYFLEAAEHGSMLKVAEKNFVTQPAVSTAITNLENELGVQLISRSKRGITLTEAGKITQKNFVLLQQQLTTLSTELEPYRKKDINESELSIRLCATLEISNTVLHNITEQFYKSYPGCTFYIKEYDFWDVVTAVKNDTADFGAFYMLDDILYDPALQRLLSQYNLCIEKIGQDFPAVGIARTSPLARKKSISLKELAQSRIVAYNSSAENCWQKQLLEQYNPNVHLIQTNSLTYCGDLMKNRDYVAFFLNQNQLMFDETAQDAFKVLPIKENKKTTVGIIYKNEPTLSPATKEFIDLLKKYFQQHLMR